MKPSVKKTKSVGLKGLLLPVVLVGAMFGIEALDQFVLTAIDLDLIFGVSKENWRGIFTHAFMHGDFAHLMSNAVPFLLMGLVLRARRDFLFVVIWGTIISGALIWIFESRGNVIHIGASSLIFAFLGFKVGLAYFSRDWKSIVIAVIFGAAYWGLLLTLMESQEGISWKGHAFGLMAGSLLSMVRAKKYRLKKK